MRDDDDLQTHPSTFSQITKQPHFPVGHILLQNMETFMAMGVDDPIKQRLGKGAFGTAFEVDLHGRSVLKLTRDPFEVQAACLLTGKTTERIVRIHGVWAIQGSALPGLRRWYAVHRAYLTPLSKRDMRLVDVIFRVYDDSSLDLTIPRRRNHGMVDKWRGYVREELSSDKAAPMDDDGGRVSAIADRRSVGRTMDLLTKIGAAVDEMHKAGIDWEDIHSGNIMRNDKGRIVIADIGWGLVHQDFAEEVPFLTPETALTYAAESSSPVASAADA
jgi:serine/threonine protein kinase